VLRKERRYVWFVCLSQLHFVVESMANWPYTGKQVTNTGFALYVGIVFVTEVLGRIARHWGGCGRGEQFGRMIMNCPLIFYSVSFGACFGCVLTCVCVLLVGFLICLALYASVQTTTEDSDYRSIGGKRENRVLKTSDF